MGTNQETAKGPNLCDGISTEDIIKAKKIRGHVAEEPVLLIYNDQKFFAIGAHCTHYGADLSGGLISENTVRCPLHHACFNLETGSAAKAPAFNSLPTWRTEVLGGKVFVREKKEASTTKLSNQDNKEFLIIGSGAAGHAAAEMLRTQGFEGKITIVTEDEDIPYDRPNLSKDYLSGKAPDEWMFLRSEEFYREQKIELKLNSRVVELNPNKKTVTLTGGEMLSFDKCLIATGGKPIKPPIKGIDLPHVKILRSFADCRDLRKLVSKGRKAVVVGGGFIGLEAASALKETGLDVTVVFPQTVPMEAAFGDEMGNFLKKLHEKNQVKFRSQQKVVEISETQVLFESGESEEADIVLIAIGIAADISLAKDAGLQCSGGIQVNKYLETSTPDIFAAGDVATFPYFLSNELIRVEHWVPAQRQGQIAAQNMMGKNIAYEDVPFFWSQQFNISFRYVGYAKDYNKIKINGMLEANDCTIAYLNGSTVKAVLTIGRDHLNLEAEQALKSGDQQKLKALCGL